MKCSNLHIDIQLSKREKRLLLDAVRNYLDWINSNLVALRCNLAGFSPHNYDKSDRELTQCAIDDLIQTRQEIAVLFDPLKSKNNE